MKKLFLTLGAILATSFASFSQISLIDAYSSLAQLPGMSKSSTSSIQIDNRSSIQDVQSSAVNTKNIYNTRNQFYYMIESLPVREVVISGNNQREIATIFAEPAGQDLYNVLILKGNSLTGDFSATYGNTTQAGIDALSNSELVLESAELTVTPAPEGSAAFISMAD